MPTWLLVYLLIGVLLLVGVHAKNLYKSHSPLVDFLTFVAFIILWAPALVLMRVFPESED